MFASNKMGTFMKRGCDYKKLSKYMIISVNLHVCTVP